VLQSVLTRLVLVEENIYSARRLSLYGEPSIQFSEQQLCFVYKVINPF